MNEERLAFRIQFQRERKAAGDDHATVRAHLPDRLDERLEYVERLRTKAGTDVRAIEVVLEIIEDEECRCLIERLFEGASKSRLERQIAIQKPDRRGIALAQRAQELDLVEPPHADYAPMLGHPIAKPRREAALAQPAEAMEQNALGVPLVSLSTQQYAQAALDGSAAPDERAPVADLHVRAGLDELRARLTNVALGAPRRLLRRDQRAQRGGVGNERFAQRREISLLECLPRAAPREEQQTRPGRLEGSGEFVGEDGVRATAVVLEEETGTTVHAARMAAQVDDIEMLRAEVTEALFQPPESTALLDNELDWLRLRRLQDSRLFLLEVEDGLHSLR